MKAEDIIFYLRKSGMTDMQYKGGKLKYVRIACPFAEIKHSNKRDRHDSFGVQVDADGTSFYHCFSCKSHGSFWQLFGTVGIHRPLDRDSLVEIGNEVYKEDVMEMATGRLSRAVQRYSYDVEDYEDTETLPDLDHMEYHFKTFSTDHEYLKHYLTDRGINHSLIKDFDIRYDDIKERIVVPIYSATGEFVGMVGRSIDPNEQVQKVYNYPGTRTDFGFGRLKGDDLSSYNRIILVEGQFDLKKTYQNLSELA